MTMDSHLTRSRRGGPPRWRTRRPRSVAIAGLNDRPALGAATPVVSAAPAAAGSVTKAVLTWNEIAVQAAADLASHPQ